MTVQTFASTNGSGPALSAGTTSVSILPGTANNLSLTLGGVPATLSIQIVSDCATTGSPATFTIAASAQDSSGSTIVAGNYVASNGSPSPLSLSITGASGFSLSGTVLASDSSSQTVSYNGSGSGSETVTLSGAGGISPQSTTVVAAPMCPLFTDSNPGVGNLGSLTSDPATFAGFTEYPEIWVATNSGAGGFISSFSPIGAWASWGPIPWSPSHIAGVTSASDGSIWFTDSVKNAIGHITSSQGWLQLGPITQNAGLGAITQGGDGRVWFLEKQVAKIGAVSASGAITEYQLTAPTSGATIVPQSIALGPDGDIWVSESVNSVGSIAHVTTSGIVDETFTVSPASPREITNGPDGALWFTDPTGNRLGRLTTGGQVQLFAVPTSNAYPTGITAGLDEAVWFTEPGPPTSKSALNRIGRIAVSNDSISEYTTPVAASGPSEITTGVDGSIWFVEPSLGEVDQAILSTANVSINGRKRR